MQHNEKWRLQDLLGKAILNNRHQLLGHIVDVEIVPDDGRINFVELQIDDAKPARSVFVPWTQISVDIAGSKLTAPFGLRFLRSISQPRD
ncbi:MAG: PRC-barrel domain-containing protein [Gammaproteobacteria bacterium]|nr:PRC-barrel domain-containing protein [Gammaproteobacteria bacterium]MBU2677827.1 PRC-barrel domain-containing protein [Gammaproteobacteria bacterium]NNL51560.1 PRC-barrel domain-containing protein [Woeseiaceae bacterium]